MRSSKELKITERSAGAGWREEVAAPDGGYAVDHFLCLQSALDRRELALDVRESLAGLRGGALCWRARLALGLCGSPGDGSKSGVPISAAERVRNWRRSSGLAVCPDP
jgi:hypothetical protein